MKFTSGNRKKAIEYEKDLIRFWKEKNVFRKSVDQRPKDNSYIFYDGPPFITGVPHHGTLLSSVVKDAVPRFWTMQGRRVERVWGWDCHGLPAEVFTEKKLGIADRRDIGTKISLEEYVTTCRDNMVATGDMWESTIDRIGRWVEFQGAYKTMDKEYMESVWWAFKKLYEKGKIYEGEKVLMYCTRDATPLSKAEIAMDNSYSEDTDPSVYVKFKLSDGSNRYVVAWTTTPWTLPSNSAIAVNKNVKYAEINFNNEVLIMADSLLEKVMKDEKHNTLLYEKLRTFWGSELVGTRYEQPFGLEIKHQLVTPENSPSSDSSSDSEIVEFSERGISADMLSDETLLDCSRREPEKVKLFGGPSSNAFKIWHADFVNDEEGTGIAHESPAYGEDDYTLAKANDIPWVISTDENGFFTMGAWKGLNVWESNKQIAKQVLADGIAIKIEYIKHSYPHCYRCDTKLMYRAVPSWFMDIDGQRTEMLEQNGSINWHPDYIKEGRFAKTVQSAPDWNLSRDRFWATAMPVWKGVNDNGEELIKVIGSYAELKELSGVELEDYHRPWVDDVTFTIDGVEYRRIEKVMDCWFESGSMPFAQFHYPFENVEKFEQSYPGDFIAEYVGQVRAWFYYLHAVNVGLFGNKAFKNVIMTGSVMGSDGKKLSKSLGNYTDPNLVMDEYGADSLRFTLLSSPVVSGEDFTLKDKDIADVNRKLSMVWNVYDFFTMYAEVDKWQWTPPKDSKLVDPSSDCVNVLDTWILSKLHSLINDVEKATKEYDLQSATRPILPFIDDLSNWYVRRSRKRFWKSVDDSDKQLAYETLHYVLIQLAHVMAPFTPFMAEELYKKLTGDESVHLRDWPKSGHVNEITVREMDAVRVVVNEGLALRAKSQLKVRQPLSKITINGGVDLGPLKENYLKVIEEELNVKEVKWNTEGDYSVSLDFDLTQPLIEEGIAREVVRAIQNARKDAGLQIDDRIVLSLVSVSDELNRAISNNSEYICTETLAKSISSTEKAHDYTADSKINGLELEIGLTKA